MTRRVHVDTDTGIDDALALLFLAAQPDVEIVGISAVYGNCVVDDALRNIGHVTRLAGRAGTPVSRGSEAPLAAEAHIAHYVHGHDGLGDVIEDRRLPEALLDLTAAEHLVKSATDAPGEVDLLTLGPLTNLARALEIDPDLLVKFRSVTIMGGSGPFPELGASHMFDANIQNDPVAAKAVFAAPATRRVMVGVNATGTVFTDEDDIAALHASGTPTGTFAADILESYLDFYQFAWGRRVAPVHDGLAAALTVHPEWIARSVAGPVNITDDGFTVRARIMTAADGTPVPWPIDEVPDTLAILTVDTDTFHRAFLDALVAGGARTQGAPV